MKSAVHFQRNQSFQVQEILPVNPFKFINYIWTKELIPRKTLVVDCIFSLESNSNIFRYDHIMSRYIGRNIVLLMLSLWSIVWEWILYYSPRYVGEG